MNKFLVLFIGIQLSFFQIKAQWVTIPDTNFVNSLTQLFPSCMSGNQLNTACNLVVNCTAMNLQGANISDLTGIEHFVNLTDLWCNYNYLTSLPALPNTLQYLECYGNQLISIAPLPNSLQHLDCNTNSLTNLPTLPNSLLYLNISFNSFTNLPALPASLQHLDCHNNQLSYFSSQLSASLQYFDCSENLYINFPPLPDSLQYFNCVNNLMYDLPALPNSLQELYCSSSTLLVLPALPPTLQILDCVSCPIATLPTLPQSLLTLDCSSNCSCGPYLDSLPQLPNSLQTLSCANRGLTYLPQLPNSLQILYCGNNPLGNLPTLPPSLETLECLANQLTSLPPLPNSLISLNCSNNQLTNLPNIPTSLQSLNVTNNQLTSLLPVPPVMYAFHISNNNISCLYNLPLLSGSPFNGSISGNPLICVPNQTTYSDGLPLCLDGDTINNPNNCISTVNIGGYIFTDVFTANCSYEGYDLESNNIPVRLYDSLNTLLAQTYTSAGSYGFMVNQTGTYRVEIDGNNLPISMACSQPDTQIVNLNSLTNGVTNSNFPVQCIQAFDVNVQAVNHQGLAFPGQIHTLNTNISSNQNWFNLNCTTATYSGVVELLVTGPVTYIGPSSAALTPVVNGNTFTYNISNFSNLNPNSFDLLFQTDTTAQAGAQICVNVNVITSPNDIDSLNNVFNFCYQVVNSYDPNMKEVYPVDVLPGYDDWFTYTIHFQNTGNAPAFNIRLKDTLDTQLDLSTFEMLGYSHPAVVSLNGNILTVRFNNIMLPDSTTDYEGSMGYFQYRLKPLPNLPNGSQIENTAYIYFDYNAPIVTNTTQNGFVFPVSVITNIASDFEFVIYPNPSSGVFSFKDTKNLQTLDVFNLVGERILSQGNQKEINLSNFANGLYFAKINGLEVFKLVKE
jgi:uncharacterized repeat protein (TIGR01451 family)